MIHEKGKDISGLRFGKLVAKYPHSRSSDNKVKYLCLCDCGNTTISFKFCLTSGKAKSCGCVSAEKSKQRSSVMTKEEKLRLFSRPTHGKSSTKEFRSWSDAKARCMNDKHVWFTYYGGRGITMCDSWVESFQKFYEDMGDCPDGCSLDRVDVNQGYFKSNCRWATSKDQQRNKTNTQWVDSPLGYLPIADLAETLNLSTACLKYRLDSGWQWEDIISKPSQRNKDKL